jgi:hypothetical protein
MAVRRVKLSAPSRRALAELAALHGGDIFHLEGEYWTIVYGGTVCRLRDAKGLHYLAHLLSHPGQRVHSNALLSVTSRRKNATPSSAERARLAVTKRIKAAVKKIEQHHAALGLHLVASIKTGYQCAYLPDPHDPTSWSI